MQPAYIFTSHLFKVFDDQEVVHEVRYAEHPVLRQAVTQLLEELVQATELTVFASVCGRCGNSCRRPDVLVREHEILPIAHKLGLNAADLVRRHLQAAQTWNPRDGVIKLEEGACPFLKAGAEPRPHSATCTIYEERPAACRNFRSDAAICLKSPGSLIEQLSVVRLTVDQCEVALKSGEVHQLEVVWYERLQQALEGLNLEPERGFAQLIDLIGQLVDLHEKSFPPDDVDEFRADLSTLRGNIQSAASLGEKDARRAAQVEELWLRLGNLEARLAKELQGDDEADQPAAAEAQTAQLGKRGLTRELAVTEQGVALRFEVPVEHKQEEGPAEITLPLAYAEYGGLLEPARQLMAEFLQAEDGLHQVQLTEADPPCFLCGECCRTYDVEIHPLDISRLCELLELEYEQFVERYTIPSRFNWNPHSRILKKVPRERARPLVLALPIAGQASSNGETREQQARECSFLEQRDDGYYYCSVHSHKPDVCRNYSARNTLCRQTNRSQHWGRQAGVLAWVSLTEHQVQGRSWRGEEDEGKLCLQRAEWPRLDQACRLLEEEVEKLLDTHLAGWASQSV